MTTSKQTSQTLHPLISRSEILGIGLVALLAAVFGGMSVGPFCILMGALIGLNSPPREVHWTRVATVALIGGIVVSAATVLHNTVLVTLPKVEAVLAVSNSPVVHLVAVVLCVITAVLLHWLRGHPNENVRRFGLLAFLVLVIIAFPFYDRQYQLLWASAIVVAMIYIVQALGLNIVAGYAGLLDLGYVAFFAIGAYTVAFLKSPHLNNYWSFWIVIWVAAAMAALFGLILGAPTLPLRGDYLAIVTLGFGEIVPIVFKNLEAVTVYEPISHFLAFLGGNPTGGICLVGCGHPFNATNGTQGINPIGAPDLTQGIVDFFRNTIGLDLAFTSTNYLPWYLLILTIVALSVFFINRLRNSRVGRAWVAMREDELAAAAMGVPIVRTKLSAFMIGAMFSGFAGAFYGSRATFISPDAFDFSISVIVLCMVILGGSGNIIGVILGGLIISLVDRLVLDRLQLIINGLLQVTLFQVVKVEALNNFMASLFDATQYKLLLFGVILVVMMLVRPQGLVPESIKRTIKA